MSGSVTFNRYVTLNIPDINEQHIYRDSYYYFFNFKQMMVKINNCHYNFAYKISASVLYVCLLAILVTLDSSIILKYYDFL